MLFAWLTDTTKALSAEEWAEIWKGAPQLLEEDYFDYLAKIRQDPDFISKMAVKLGMNSNTDRLAIIGTLTCEENNWLHEVFSKYTLYKKRRKDSKFYHI